MPALRWHFSDGHGIARSELRAPVSKGSAESHTLDRVVDMIEEGFDLVIRADPVADKGLVGRVFLRDRLVVVASPDLVRPIEGHANPAIVRVGRDRSVWQMQHQSKRLHLGVAPGAQRARAPLTAGAPDIVEPVGGRAAVIASELDNIGHDVRLFDSGGDMMRPQPSEPDDHSSDGDETLGLYSRER